MRSFSDPDTHFTLLRSGTPPTVDGLTIYEHTGEVQCDICGAVAMHVYEIAHDDVSGAPCPQADVKGDVDQEQHRMG